MPEEKGLGSKFLGLFVDTSGNPTPAEGSEAVEKGEKSAAEMVAELAGQTAVKGAPKGSAAAPPAPVSPMANMPKHSGPVAVAQVDFDSVFKSAGMDAAELDRVKKAEDLLKSLPESTPNDIKRQIVEASLKAFGFDIQKIGVAALNQMKALDTYVRINEQSCAKGITDAQKQIADFEDKVISLKADITKKTENLASVSLAATERKNQVSRVLEFFNVAPPAVK
jgi:hypothetical protein